MNEDPNKDSNRPYEKNEQKRPYIEKSSSIKQIRDVTKRINANFFELSLQYKISLMVD